MIRKLEALVILLSCFNIFIFLQTFPFQQFYTNITKQQHVADVSSPKKELLPPVVTTATPPPTQTPTAGPEDSGSLPLVISHGDRSKKEIALTFDADMTQGMVHDLVTHKVSSYYNAKVIQTLTNEHIPATLFLTGLWTKMYPTVTKQLAKNSLFEIGNHTYDHDAFTNTCFGLPQVVSSGKRNEITKTSELLSKVTGKEPMFFRFPGGCYSQADLKLLQALGIHAVMWDDVSGDSYLINPKAIVKQTLSQAQNGSIIVLHMSGGIAKATGDALPAIISDLKQKGYTFVTLSQLLNIPQQTPQIAKAQPKDILLTPTSFITPIQQKTFLANSYPLKHYSLLKNFTTAPN